MKRWIPAILGAAAAAVVLVLFIVFTGSTAHCEAACIGQFCGNTAECPGGCFCAKEHPSNPTGRCLGG